MAMYLGYLEINTNRKGPCDFVFLYFLFFHQNYVANNPLTGYAYV